MSSVLGFQPQVLILSAGIAACLFVVLGILRHAYLHSDDQGAEELGPGDLDLARLEGYRQGLEYGIFHGYDMAADVAHDVATRLGPTPVAAELVGDLKHRRDELAQVADLHRSYLSQEDTA